MKAVVKTADKAKVTYRNHKYDITPIVAQLRSLRMTYGASLTDIGVMLGHPRSNARSFISSYELGACRPRVDILEAWATTLGQCILAVPISLRKLVQNLALLSGEQVTHLTRQLEHIDDEQFCAEIRSAIDGAVQRAARQSETNTNDNSHVSQLPDSVPL